MGEPCFDFHLPTRIVFGSGCIARLGELAAAWGAGRALVASDPGVIAAGHTLRGLDALRAAGVASLLFDGVRENPTTDDVERGVEAARSFRPDLLVAIGGGSAMDCAKGINFLYTNGGRMQDYWGVGKAKQPMLPAFAAPTTAGTGSEAQSFALISDAVTHAKMACGDKKAAFRAALLDPDLTLTQPPRITALTGIDAITHALETYVCTRRNPLSQAFSREAWRLLAPHFGRVLADPGDREARAAMQLGACYAGLAIENSMLGAAHALANPLTAAFQVPHGQAVGAMLPHVIRCNAGVVAGEYRELAGSLAGVAGGPRCEDANGLADFVAAQLESAGLARQLRALGVPREALPRLASDASRQWTGTFNPRPLSEADFLQLYEQAWGESA